MEISEYLVTNWNFFCVGIPIPNQTNQMHWITVCKCKSASPSDSDNVMSWFSSSHCFAYELSLSSSLSFGHRSLFMVLGPWFLVHGSALCLWPG